MSRKDLKPMKREALEDEVMLLRAQVKVLQDWLRAGGVRGSLLDESVRATKA